MGNGRTYNSDGFLSCHGDSDWRCAATRRAVTSSGDRGRTGSGGGATARHRCTRRAGELNGSYFGVKRG